MADTAKKTTAPKKTRKVLTLADRLAKKEQELADLRTKATEKADKERTSLTEKRDKLDAKIAALQTERNEVNAQVEALGSGGDVPDGDPIEAMTAVKVDEV